MEEALEKMTAILQTVVEKQMEMDKKITELSGTKEDPKNKPTEAEIKTFVHSSKS